MIRALLFSGLAALPASAQSFDEAVRQNLALGLDICLRNMPLVDPTRTRLSAAGFAYTPEPLGGGDMIHWYTAPADTLAVAIVAAQTAPECRVSTAHLGVTDAIALAGAYLTQHLPALGFTYGSLDNSPPVTPETLGTRWEFCTGYVGWNGQRPITLAFANDGNDPACIEDGTTQIVIQH